MIAPERPSSSPMKPLAELAPLVSGKNRAFTEIFPECSTQREDENPEVPPTLVPD